MAINPGNSGGPLFNLEAHGQEVDHSTTLPRLIGGVAPGEEVELLVLREGERQSITLEVGEWPDAGAGQAGNDSKPARLGIAAQPLSGTERQQLGIDHGVHIAGAHPGTALPGWQLLLRGLESRR